MRRRLPIRARAGFPEDRLVGVVGCPAGCAVLDCSKHAGGQFGDHILDWEMALDARSEVLNIFLAAWVLQPVQRATVGNGRNRRGKLEGCQRDTLSETCHHSHSPVRGWSIGQPSRLLKLNIQPCLLSKTEKLTVIGDLLVA